MRRSRKSINQINVVPYIDVMLVLLVIFMVTAPLMAPGEIELPSIGSRPKPPQQPLTVTINADKSLSLQEQPAGTAVVRVSREELVKRLQGSQAKSPEQSVVIAADKNARYQDVLDVLDLLQRNQIKKVGLLARPTGN